jgi:hypothetical protein
VVHRRIAGKVQMWCIKSVVHYKWDGVWMAWGWCIDRVVDGARGCGWGGASEGRVMHYNDVMHRDNMVQWEGTFWGHCSYNSFCIMDLL